VLRYRLQADWPPLAWFAECRANSDEILVRHGADVETREAWFCEAAWDDDFDHGDFDRTANVYGSGGRLRGGTLTFVSSGSTCDRLQHLRIGDTSYVSNSLACLAGLLDLELDPWYPWYYEDLASIATGLDRYKTELDSNRGAVTLTYYQNLAWDGRQLAGRDKPADDIGFADYAGYREWMATILHRLGVNLGDPRRGFRYTPLSTCSSGYDSLAVTVLARTLGAEEAICVVQDRIERDDSGVKLAEQLGLRAHALERHDWRDSPDAELQFIAADACGRDLWLHPARGLLHHRLLLTGHMGGIWDLHQSSRGDFERLDAGGLSLSEFRLDAGFLHCPLLFIGTLDTSAMQRLSRSDEMRPWVLGNTYDRPVARRIIEEAGIPRGRFATRKTATAVHLFRRSEFDRFFTGTDSLRDYLRWLRRQSRETPPPAVDAYPLTTTPRETIEVPLFRQLLPWALAHARRRYTV